ncbi:MAG TPA: integration host factor subunit alpha [Methylocystis sp.]|nr:integration host factor subunit alpha [Methylocystis sp.]
MRDAQPSQSTLTRADLARSVQKAIGVSRDRASIYVEQLFEEIFERLINGEEVKLSAFGNFSVREKRERDGRNPKTGVKATIKARRVVVFRASQVLRARVGARSPFR